VPMRVHRIALVAIWMVVSLLAVVGFANFSATGPTTEPVAVPPTYAPDLGTDAGAVSAMAFAFPGERGLSGRAVVEEEPAPDLEEAASDKPVRPSTTFVRSTVLNESAVRELVGYHFLPEDVSRAIRSAWCASSFDPGYENSETGAAGLFQLTPQQWADNAAAAGQAAGDIYDPRDNAAVAAWIVYQSTGSWSNLVCTG
jgi:hypothetical protein